MSRVRSTCLPVVTVLMSWAFISPAQAGDLNPPVGPVAPTMKTLDEVEPRIPVESLPGTAIAHHGIIEAGSYYMTENLKPIPGEIGIRISASDVTLDLMGHTIDGLGASGDGILIDAEIQRVVIRNGFIRNAGGMALNGEEAQRVVVENVHVVASAQEGIFLGSNSTLRQCSVQDCNGGLQVGSDSLVIDCISENSIDGIRVSSNSRVIQSVATNNTGGGIIGLSSSSAIDCTATGNGGVGISLGIDATVENCIARNNGTMGIALGDGSTITNSTADDNGHTGILVDDTSNIRGCAARNNTNEGFSAGLKCFIKDCIASDNGRHGFFCSNYTTIQDCSSYGNSSHGFSVGQVCRIIGNSAYNNSLVGNFAGIKCPGSLTLIDSNQVWSCRVGIDVDFASNTIVRNISYDNAINNYEIAGGNRLGTIVASPVGAGAWDNISY